MAPRKPPTRPVSVRLQLTLESRVARVIELLAEQDPLMRALSRNDYIVVALQQRLEQDESRLGLATKGSKP